MLGTHTTLILLIVLSTSSVQLPDLLTTTIDIQHPLIILLALWAGIISTLGDWFLNSLFYEIHCRLVNIHMLQLISPATFIGKHDNQLKYANGAYWSSGYNVGFWIQRVTVQIPTSVCCVLRQDALSALHQSTQL